MSPFVERAIEKLRASNPTKPSRVDCRGPPQLRAWSAGRVVGGPFNMFT
jgi:hypothetical protein